MNENGEGEQLREDTADRPAWMTDELVESTIRHFRSRTSEPFGVTDAVQVLLSLSQLLDATSLLKLGTNDESKD